MRKVIYASILAAVFVGCEGDTIKFCRCNHPNPTAELLSGGAEYYMGGPAPAVTAPLYVEVQD
jgi:hypothetical protein